VQTGSTWSGPTVAGPSREIEDELRQRGEREVSRDRIRGLAAEILERRFGEETARLYRVWRHYQDGERPVIVLLGGTSGVGKSSLGLDVARRLSIRRVLSTDSVRDVMRIMLSDELVPTLHVSSFEAHRRFQIDGRERDPVIDGFLEQSRTVCVGVRAVVDRAIMEGTSTVLDGVSLVPGMLDLERWADRAHVFFLLAADIDRESLHGHLAARVKGGGARASKRYLENFQEIVRIQEHLLERAEVTSVPIVDVQDMEAAARQVVGHVVGSLRDQREARPESVD
jgi:2-phosphoglycerate kinase